MENNYLELFFKLEKAKWDKYTQNSNIDLSIIQNQIYTLCQSIDIKEIKDRKDKLLNFIKYYNLIEFEPEVIKLKEKLLNKDSYTQGLKVSINDNPIEYYSVLAQKMKPDLIKLMKLRNSLSQNYGFNSYLDLIFWIEELNVDNVITLLENYIETNIFYAKNIMYKYQITPYNWTFILNNIKANFNFNSYNFITNFFYKLSLPNLNENIKITFNESINSINLLSIPKDIRILIVAPKTLKDYLNLFHILGHGISYATIKENGIFSILPNIQVETIAILTEYIGSLMFFNNTDQEIFKEIKTLENIRCAISSLFEFSLWKHIDNIESIYSQYYNNFGLEIFNPLLWISEFNANNAMYSYNYVVGEILAMKLLNYLINQFNYSFNDWGKWLESNILSNGNKIEFREKLKIIEFVA